jgi:hypothetical protein
MLKTGSRLRHTSKVTMRAIHQRAIAVVAASLLAMTLCDEAEAAARMPSISGNWWVAVVIAVAFVAIVVLLVRGALFLQWRDARLGEFYKEEDDDMNGFRDWF